LTEAFDLVLRWLHDTCHAHVALLRAQPTTGEMKAIRVSWGAPPPPARAAVSRVGFSRSMGSNPGVSVRTKPADPLLTWLRAELGEVKDALVAPVVVSGRIWGAIAQPGSESVPREVCSRALRAAALALSEHVQREEDDRPKAETSPKHGLGIETFLRRVDQAMAEPGEGTNVVLAAALAESANAAETRAAVIVALDAALATARVHDVGAVYADDAAVLLLRHVADADLSRFVQRFRSVIWRCSPGAPTSGITAAAVTPAAGSAREQVEHLVVAARMLRVKR